MRQKSWEQFEQTPCGSEQRPYYVVYAEGGGVNIEEVPAGQTWTAGAAQEHLGSFETAEAARRFIANTYYTPDPKETEALYERSGKAIRWALEKLDALPQTGHFPVQVYRFIVPGYLHQAQLELRDDPGKGETGRRLMVYVWNKGLQRIRCKVYGATAEELRQLLCGEDSYRELAMLVRGLAELVDNLISPCVNLPLERPVTKVYHLYVELGEPGYDVLPYNEEWRPGELREHVAAFDSLEELEAYRMTDPD